MASVRTIRKDGVVVGYQALAGTGRKGESKYFSVKKYGDQEAHQLALTEAREGLGVGRPSRAYQATRRNSKGIPGLRFVWIASRDHGRPPILYAVATFFKNGRDCKRCYSTEKHGLLPAVEMAKHAREVGAGVKIPGTVQSIESIMRAALAAGNSRP